MSMNEAIAIGGVLLKCRYEKPGDRDTIYRLQYEGFCTELKQVDPTPEMQRTHRWVSSTDAFNKYIVLEVMNTGEIIGTISITPPNREYFFEKDYPLSHILRLSEALVPGTPDRTNICEIRSLVVKKKYRRMGNGILGHILALTASLAGRKLFGAKYVIIKGHSATTAKIAKFGYQPTGLKVKSGNVWYEVVIGFVDYAAPLTWKYLTKLRLVSNTEEKSSSTCRSSVYSILPYSSVAKARASSSLSDPQLHFFWSDSIYEAIRSLSSVSKL